MRVAHTESGLITGVAVGVAVTHLARGHGRHAGGWSVVGLIILIAIVAWATGLTREASNDTRTDRPTISCMFFDLEASPTPPEGCVP